MMFDVVVCSTPAARETTDTAINTLTVVAR
jgi:hypothetical protein